MKIFKSFYKISGTDLCLETPLKEINDFCDYMWQEFPGQNSSNDIDIIKVLSNKQEDDYFSIYKNGEIAYDFGLKLDKVPYKNITRVLENIVAGHAINQVDKTRLITLHAGAVSLDNKGILILGDSGNGKSTLTMELVANHGWSYLTDEIGLLDPNLILQPFLKTVSCKQTGIVKINNKWITKKFGIDTEITVPKEKHSSPVPLKAVFFVKFCPNKQPVIEIEKKTKALQRLMSSQIGRAKSVASFEQILEIVKNVNSYNIFHNNCTKAAELISELIDKND